MSVDKIGAEIMSTDIKQKRVKKVIRVNAVLLLVAAALLTLEFLGLLHTTCLEYYFLGFFCPGCGTTRLCRAVLAGDFYQAFRYNPLVFILIPVFAVMYICETVKYLKYGKFSKYLNYILIAIAVVLNIYGIIRNLPFLSFLAPVQL